jgi:RecB family exonuclease
VAYYFYRLISRAENVWLLYDSRTEGLKNGEESRYIKQLRYHFVVPISNYIADAEPGLPSNDIARVEKTPEIMEILAKRTLSPSALQNYIECPMRFYYYSVVKLKKDREVAENMDPAMIGTVYHNTMWALYTSEAEMMSDAVYDKRGAKPEPMPKVTKEYLESWTQREDDIRRKVESLMCAELGVDEIVGRNLVTVSVIVRYVQETIKRDIELLQSHGAGYFKIVGLERPLKANLYGQDFYGVADRIDIIGESPYVRMVDYKSGKDDPAVLATGEATAEATARLVFGADGKTDKKVKAALQFFIYDKMLEANGYADLSNIANTMYATACLFSGRPEVNPLNPVFAQELDTRLESLIKEIKSPEIPFEMTSDESKCKICDFRMICGR